MAVDLETFGQDMDAIAAALRDYENGHIDGDNFHTIIYNIHYDMCVTYHEKKEEKENATIQN